MLARPLSWKFETKKRKNGHLNSLPTKEIQKIGCGCEHTIFPLEMLSNSGRDKIKQQTPPLRNIDYLRTTFLTK